MTPMQLKIAARLYQRFKTDAPEYKRIAAELGICVTDLNLKMWHHFHDKKNAALAAKYAKRRGI